MKNKKKNNINWSPIAFAWQLGYNITIPLIVLALIGRILDKKFNSSPYLFMVSILLSIIISSYIVYFKASKTIKKISESKNN